MEHKPSFSIFSADLGHLFSDTLKYKEGAIKLKELDQNQSFHLVCSLVFELFPKVLLGYKICKKHKDSKDKEEIRKDILKEFLKNNHDIKKLFEKFPDLLTFLEIEKIKHLKNGVVDQYEFTLKNNKIIIIKNIEAIRYGSFAKNKNIATLYTTDKDIILLLNKMAEYINKKRVETSKYLLDRKTSSPQI